MTTLEKVRQLTAEEHGLNIEEITAQTDFFEDLDDSLNFVSIVMGCEEEFNILIPDEELQDAQITTVGALANYIDNRMCK